jgi:hypothetical protein
VSERTSRERVVGRPALGLVQTQTDRLGLGLRHSVNIVAAAANCVEQRFAWAALLVNLVFAGWSVARLLTRRTGRGCLLGDVLAAVVYLSLTPVLVTGTSFTTGPSAPLAVAGTAVVSFAIAVPSAGSLAVTVAIMTAWAFGSARVAGVSNPFTIFSLNFLAVEWALAVLLRRLVIRSADLTDTALAAVANAELTRTVAAARRRSQRQQWATLHDTAASTLSMIGQGAHTEPSRLRSQVARDLSAIAMAPPIDNAQVVDLVPLLGRVIDESPLSVELRGHPTLLTDSRISRAVVEATREALTNVHRHANAQRVSVDVADSTVAISDDGIGFDVAAHRVQQRHGVRNSIVRRMADADAHADIHTEPGAGTRIVLSWARTPVDATTATTQDVVDRSRWLLRSFGYGLCAIAIIDTILQGPRAVAAPAINVVPQSGLIVLVLACAVAGLVDIRHRLPAALRWTAIVLLIAAVPTQILLLNASQLGTGANWALSALGWPLAALTFRDSLKRSLAALAALWGGGCITVIGRSPDLTTVTGLVYNVASVAVVQAVALGFAVFLLRAVSESEQISREHTAVTAGEAVDDALQADFATRSENFSSTLVPLLRRIADTPAPAHDSQLRAACLRESARLRRLFAQADTFDHPVLVQLEPAIAAAERRGVAITVDTGTTLPESQPHDLTSLVGATAILLNATKTHARVVMTSPQHDDLVISIVCDCDDSARLDAEAEIGTAATSLTLTVSGDTTWAEISHTTDAGARR